MQRSFRLHMDQLGIAWDAHAACIPVASRFAQRARRPPFNTPRPAVSGAAERRRRAFVLLNFASIVGARRRQASARRWDLLSTQCEAGVTQLEFHDLPSSIVLIVEGYVNLRDREALERLRNHRQQMLVNIRGLSGLDVTHTIGELEHELEVIDGGLNDLTDRSAI